VIVENGTAGAEADLPATILELRRYPAVLSVQSLSFVTPDGNGTFVNLPLHSGDWGLKLTGPSDIKRPDPGFGGTASFVGARREPVAAQLPANFKNAYVKSLRAVNAEVAGTRLRVPSEPAGPIDVEVLLSFDGGQLSGVARSASGNAESNVTVALVPAQPERPENYRSVFTGNDGRFRFDGIAPGDYRLFCWEDVQTDDWLNPTVLAAFQDRGKLVHIDEGARVNLDALMIPIRE
jgi:hypothetical protein